MHKNFYRKDAKYAKKEKQCLMLLSALRVFAVRMVFMLKNFYREDDKSRAVGPFGKLRDRVTEALARHSRVGGNPEIQAAKNGSPHTRG
jgi:hypothetical protein